MVWMMVHGVKLYGAGDYPAPHYQLHFILAGCQTVITLTQEQTEELRGRLEVALREDQQSEGINHDI